MKVLVTGGCGFIGSHLVDLLCDSGHEVRVLDNLSNGKLVNISGRLEAGEVDYLKADVCDKEAVLQAAQDRTHIFHLAALADIVPSINSPRQYFDSNVVGTLNVMEAARSAGVTRVVYAASSSCYGIPSRYPTPEDAPTDPQYPYALTKLQGEELVLHWGKVYNIPSTSLRLFNVYGPRSRTSGTYGAVFGVFLAQKRAGKPMTIVGDGYQERDFTFVSDVARAFMAAAESDRGNLVLNVGTGTSQSINRLVDLLGGDRVYIPKRPGEPDLTLAAIESVSEALGWAPLVSFESGVEQMLEHLDEWSEAPVWEPDTIAEATQEWFARLGNVGYTGS